MLGPCAGVLERSRTEEPGRSPGFREGRAGVREALLLIVGRYDEGNDAANDFVAAATGLL